LESEYLEAYFVDHVTEATANDVKVKMASVVNKQCKYWMAGTHNRCRNIVSPWISVVKMQQHGWTTFLYLMPRTRFR